MKKFLCILLVGVGFSVHAQEATLPAIQKGSKLNYIVYANGEEVPLTVTLDSITTDYVKFGWSISGYGSGGWIMKKPSLEKAKRNAWEQPGLGMDTELPDDQVVLILSKASWTALRSEKKTEIDQQVFSVATPQSGQEFAIAGKAVDALFIQSQASGAKIWVLNQPELPLLLKIQGNAAGFDLELRSVE